MSLYINYTQIYEHFFFVEDFISLLEITSTCAKYINEVDYMYINTIVEIVRDNYPNEQVLF